MKHIIFCLPGAPTLQAAMSWDDLRSAFAKRPDLRMSISRGGGASVRHVRNQLLEVGVSCPMKLAKPFGGQDYDFMMWIDSDSVYKPEDFFRLLELDVDIVAAVVPIDLEPGRAAAGKIDLATGTTAYLRLGTMPSEPMEVEWSGFAFLLVKRGVFETLTYPWFDSQYFDVGDRIVDPGEDIRWCLRVREKGFRIVLDPRVRIGHEKLFILEAPPAPPAASANLLERFIDRYDEAWRLSRPALEAIRDLLEQRKPKKVLEIGPGASSFVTLPWCLANAAVYQALDHQGPYSEKHLANLKEAGLPSDTTFAVPLDQEGAWYSRAPLAIDQEAPYDMVIVDGPITGRACTAALAAYERWGHPKTAWVFDDANREEELKAAMHVAGNRMVRRIQDPQYPRTTILLIPLKELDARGEAVDTVGSTDAEAVGSTASKGQPEARV